MRIVGEQRASGIGASVSLGLHGVLAVMLLWGASTALCPPTAEHMPLGACVVQVQAAPEPLPAALPQAPVAPKAEPQPAPLHRPAPATPSQPPAPLTAPAPAPTAPAASAAPAPPKAAAVGAATPANAPAPLGNPSGIQRAAALRDQLVAALIGRIERAKRYPFAARKAGIEGVVTMRVRIDEAGRIAEYSVRTDGAPHRWLCDAAVQTMAEVDPHLLPQGKMETALVVEVPIRFHLQ
ncbi:outer membrane transport energization protein TonB [Humidesulfovibrio mexicanus]|uniref:Outer membrane transport energization protein TonB n=1 Tax=Humidesulfovibrio mexicanus TaxID=147047 RepID=A0A239BK28_9BACT|nr:TonB family protein [Humidesulfovibrio mexicanus]SNS07384.1 outer membrane transport energization protein TonB [Humidesulfovibrio mexicanus]